MSRALPSDLAPVADSKGAAMANAGLRLLRWVDFDDQFEVPGDKRDAHLAAIVGHFGKASPTRPIVASILASYRARACARSDSLKSQGYGVRSLLMRCSARFLMSPMFGFASEWGLVLHRNLGVPYIPSASIKGLMRTAACSLDELAWPEHLRDQKARSRVIEKLYGSELGAKQISRASVTVFDAMPVDVPNIEVDVVSPHMGGWNKWDGSGDAPAPRISEAPELLKFLAVAKGTEFEFVIAARDAEDLELANLHLEAALEWIGAGARTASGFGALENPDKIVEEVIELPKPAPEPPKEVVAKVDAAVVHREEPVAKPVAVEPERPAVPSEPVILSADTATGVVLQSISLQYQSNSGQVVVTFKPPSRSDAVRAQEHVNTVVMSEEVKMRLKKKKFLTNIFVEVIPVGNGWKLKSIQG
jgi:CRISPR type III-B/RAMP module RAMP protein Cmr6